jgi:predicted amidohydrolase YtcJ
MGSNGNDHDYVQCGCHNPVWNALKDRLDPVGHTAASQSRSEQQQAIEAVGESIVFTGGTIYPLRDGNMDERVEALGIHAGDVVAAGTLAAVEARMQALGIAYRKQSLNGRTLLPGLIEPHAHIVQSCAMEGWLNLGAIDSDSLDEHKNQRLRPLYDWSWLKTTIRDNLPEDSTAWILGHMVDPALMPFEIVPGNLNKLLTLHCGPGDEIGNLDTIDKQHPMLLISASMHTAYLNTAASDAVYKKTGIRARNGILQEAEVLAAIKTIPLKQQLDILKIFKHLENYFDTAARRGITLLYDAMMDPISKLVLSAYFLTRPRKLRIGYAAACDGTAKGIGQLPPYRAASREEAKRIYQGSVKLVSDGSNQGLTGYQSTRYCCETDFGHSRGNFNFCDEHQPAPVETPEAYKALVQNAIDTGWPLMIHANGDRAVQFTLQAYADALQGGSALKKRHRIEHCSLLNEDSLQTMKLLGLSPSFLIGHVGYWGYAFKQAIFQNKAEQMLDLCQSALDHDLRISLHSDCSVTPLGPLRSMEQAVTRKMEGIRDAQGRFVHDPRLQPILNEAECLTRKQALKAITYDAAWQCHAEGWSGSLQDGHFADFVILGQDPLDETVPATSIRDITVCETWKGGQRVYVNSAS